MGFTDDILALPFGLKFLLGFILALGGSVKFIPFIDLDVTSDTFGKIIWYGVGQIIFAPLTYIFSLLLVLGFSGLSWTSFFGGAIVGGIATGFYRLVKPAK